MEKNAENIAKMALGLSTTARAYIAELLLESLDFEEDFEVPEHWMDEIEKRCREIDAGEVDLIDGNTALAELRAKYGTV